MHLPRPAKIIALAGLVLSMTPPALANDWEYWSHYEMGGKITPQLGYKVAPEFRFNADFAEHYYTHVEAGVDWKGQSWLTISPYSDIFLN